MTTPDRPYRLSLDEALAIYWQPLPEPPSIPER
jgi:hypothetical protein